MIMMSYDVNFSKKSGHVRTRSEGRRNGQTFAVSFIDGSLPYFYFMILWWPSFTITYSFRLEIGEIPYFNNRVAKIPYFHDRVAKFYSNIFIKVRLVQLRSFFLQVSKTSELHCLHELH